jgi:hypothetical protein
MFICICLDALGNQGFQYHALNAYIGTYPELEVQGGPINMLTGLICYHFSLSAITIETLINLSKSDKPGIMDVVTNKMCSMLTRAEQPNRWDQMMKTNLVCSMKTHQEHNTMAGTMMDPHWAVPISLFLSTNLCSMVELVPIPPNEMFIPRLALPFHLCSQTTLLSLSPPLRMMKGSHLLLLHTLKLMIVRQETRILL